MEQLPSAALVRIEAAASGALRSVSSLAAGRSSHSTYVRIVTPANVGGMASIGLSVLAVACLNVYALVLIVLRGTLFKTRIYRPMALNLGLSLVPVLVALALVVGSLVLVNGIQRLTLSGGPALLWVFLAVMAAVWILFFPNAMYLITELNLSHRRAEDPVPLWFDIVQTLTLTVSGIANAVVSLAIVQFFAVLVFADPNTDHPSPPGRSWVFAIAVIVLGSLGMYLGRYLRLNSWDVRHPGSMLRKTRVYYSSLRRVADTLGFLATHSLLMVLLYVPLFYATYRLLLTAGAA